jgi:probable rRNA maturation factor
MQLPPIFAFFWIIVDMKSIWIDNCFCSFFPLSNEVAMTVKIDWSSRSKLRGPGEQSIGGLVRKLCAKLSAQTKGISITYVDDRNMRKLNRQYRGLNKTTDVLCFPASPEKGEFQHLGDIVISLETAEKKAKRFNVSRRRQVETLIIHGFLHLCGHDHEKDSGEMLSLQATLEKELLEDEPLPMSKKRGRKPGSKLKTLKSGSRVVVTGRAAQAILRREKMQKEKSERKAEKAKAKIKGKATAKPKPKPKPKPKAKSKAKPKQKATINKAKRNPGRPAKAVTKKITQKQASKRQPRKKRVAKIRSGVIF